MSYQENTMHSGQECPATNGNGLQKPSILIEEIENILLDMAVDKDTMKEAEEAFIFLRNLFINIDAFHDNEREINRKLKEKRQSLHHGGGRPKRKDKKITKAFAYDAGEDTNVRLQLLYRGLLELKWIKADTDLRYFLNLFSGGETTCRVVWTGGMNTLAELFKELVTRKRLVRLPKGESIWVMVNARFWNKEGNKEFGNDALSATRTPVKDKEAIATLVKMLDPKVPIDVLRKTARR